MHQRFELQLSLDYLFTVYLTQLQIMPYMKVSHIWTYSIAISHEDAISKGKDERKSFISQYG